MDIFQNEAQGTYASATVVNAKTGEILATTQRPTYNAQTLDGYSEDNLEHPTLSELLRTRVNHESYDPCFSD